MSGGGGNEAVGAWETKAENRSAEDGGGTLQAETDHDRSVNKANEITGLRRGSWKGAALHGYEKNGKRPSAS